MILLPNSIRRMCLTLLCIDQFILSVFSSFPPSVLSFSSFKNYPACFVFSSSLINLFDMNGIRCHRFERGQSCCVYDSVADLDSTDAFQPVFHLSEYRLCWWDGRNQQPDGAACETHAPYGGEFGGEHIDGDGRPVRG